MDAVGSGQARLRDFSPEELGELRKNESTEKLMNQVGRDAGYLRHDVGLRGDDPTFREQEAEFHEVHAVQKQELAVHVTAQLIEIGEIGGLLGGCAVVVPAVFGLFAGLHGLAEANEHGQQLNETLRKDELHLALVTHLEVPKGYVAQEVQKRADSGKGNLSGAMKMVTPFETKDKSLKAVLQLHCDEGMNAARRMIGGGSKAATFFAENPAIKQRVDADAAFRAGFDGLRWAREHGEYDATLKALDSRDARYDANHIGCRG